MSGRPYARITTGVEWSGLACIVLVVTRGGVVVTPQSADRLNVCHAGSVQLAFTAVEILGPVGTAAFNANGPTAISPAVVSSTDYAHLPKSLKQLVTTGSVP